MDVDNCTPVAHLQTQKLLVSPTVHATVTARTDLHARTRCRSLKTRIDHLDEKVIIQKLKARYEGKQIYVSVKQPPSVGGSIETPSFRKI